ncbi:MAG: hypothetical protein AUG51_18315 [Acidobacteria bacterium 13_1_20CM_3_53_8]|nr:MAG: hypothetical protein AUG51_18315 [Acidobacteria bacterium 13_1_20CM_3_53_8]
MEPYRIWKDVDELAFYENSIILELLGRSQGNAPPKLATSEVPFKTNDPSHDLEWVTHLLDDFALVAAGAGGAANVAAASLEFDHVLENCFIVRVAKNEDFTIAQFQCLKDIIIIMNQVKQRGKPLC